MNKLSFTIGFFIGTMMYVTAFANPTGLTDEIIAYGEGLSNETQQEIQDLVATGAVPMEDAIEVLRRASILGGGLPEGDLLRATRDNNGPIVISD